LNNTPASALFTIINHLKLNYQVRIPTKSKIKRINGGMDKKEEENVTRGTKWGKLI